MGGLIQTDLRWQRRDEYQSSDLLRFYLVGADHKTCLLYTSDAADE